MASWSLMIAVDVVNRCAKKNGHVTTVYLKSHPKQLQGGCEVLLPSAVVELSDGLLHFQCNRRNADIIDVGTLPYGLEPEYRRETQR